MCTDTVSDQKLEEGKAWAKGSITPQDTNHWVHVHVRQNSVQENCYMINSRGGGNVYNGIFVYMCVYLVSSSL